jgi:tyrocidine synthetase-3
LSNTGDLASWTEEGTLLYHGRIDNQVKIRGNRIEVGEIEEALRSHDSISDAVVLVQKDKSGQNVLAGHYCLCSPCEPESLRLFLSEKIPPYMIPGLWKRHLKFDLTTSGKTDRKLIKPITFEKIEKKPQVEAFSLESAIIEEWKKVLPDGNFTCDDDFFNIGGDSFSLISVFTNLGDKYHLTLQELFDYSTVNSLTRFILETKTFSLIPNQTKKIDWEPLNTISRERKRLSQYQDHLEELKECS